MSLCRRPATAVAARPAPPQNRTCYQYRRWDKCAGFRDGGRRCSRDLEFPVTGATILEPIEFELQRNNICHESSAI